MLLLYVHMYIHAYMVVKGFPVRGVHLAIDAAFKLKFLVIRQVKPVIKVER